MVPQSLGNSKHKLPPGWVCDSCNHYFAIKVEKPVLDSDYFRHARHRNRIISKKGRIPPLEVVFGPNGEELGMYVTPKGQRGIYALSEAAESSWINHLFTKGGGSIYIVEPRKADRRDVSRLLTKVALEIFAFRLHHMIGWNDVIVDHRQLDEIRGYARFGVGMMWPFYERRIYSENKEWISKTGESTEVLHEFDVLVTPWQEYFAIICILGVEYVVNLGGAEIDGYVRWLNENESVSPLYSGRNASV
ncbi:MAG: hypothetical protein QOJ45_2646 [Verrucomicrobiota bacterium]